MMKYIVAVTAEHTLEVEMPAHDLADGLDVGAEVDVSWRIPDTRVLPT
jgi:hypothetical protein